MTARAKDDLWERSDTNTMQLAKHLIAAFKDGVPSGEPEAVEYLQLVHTRMHEVQQRPGKAALILELGALIKKHSSGASSESTTSDEIPKAKGPRAHNWGKMRRAVESGQSPEAEHGGGSVHDDRVAGREGESPNLPAGGDDPGGGGEDVQGEVLLI